jgi:ribulose-phosphate 3-epimerase
MMDARAPAAGPALDQAPARAPRLSVGILTANLLELGSELTRLASSGAELVHIDVMDGVFCPQITVGPPVVQAVRTPLLKDVHLMIDDPLSKVDAFVAAGADMITFHLEGARQPHRVLQSLAGATTLRDPARRVIRGVGLNPSTPVEALEPLLDDLEYVLVVAINPGWSGQSFLPSTDARIERVRRLIDAAGRPILVGVDGGVTRANIDHVASLGADIVVSGSAIFDGKDVAANAAFMLDRVRAGFDRRAAGDPSA